MVARLNPTSNGPIHIGHVFNALVNRAESDELVLRFDDNQSYWLVNIGAAAMQQYAAGQLRDFQWMGFVFSEVVYNSYMKEEMLAEMSRCSHYRAVYDHWPLNPEDNPIIVSDPRIEAWGPMFYLTTEKVILDHATGVTVMARGLELLQENSLYLYLCGIFGYSMPKMIYIPRLMTHDGDELTNISKTAGNWKIEQLREDGLSREGILLILRRACLLDSEGGWEVSNIKPNPAIQAKDARR